MSRISSKHGDLPRGDFADLALPVRCDERSLQVLERVRRYAKHDRAIIALEGESGTGKNRIARHIHQVSHRAARPFREVSLAALDDGIAGSELFGHVQGAFTDARQRRDGHFASANGGTLFLDELGKSSAGIQKKLLRVLESGEVWPVGSDRAVRVDVRLVTATNIPLQDLVTRGEFLPDLYARLGCFRIRIPPLRERPADIAPLVEHFVVTHGPSFGYDTPPVVHPDLMEALERATWPFNVRELEGTMMRLLVDADGAPVLTLRLCVDDLAHLAAPVRQERPALSLETVRRAVAETGSVSAAARSLGVHRATLYRQFPDIASDGTPMTSKLEARQN